MKNFFIIIISIFACIAVAKAQEAAGNLVIVGNIKDAYLKIDNQPSELILGDSLSKTLAPGNYSYEISRIGYEIERGTFTIRQGENTVLKMNLTPGDEESKVVSAPEQAANVPNNDMKEIMNKLNTFNENVIKASAESKSGKPWIIAGTVAILGGITATILTREDIGGYVPGKIPGDEYVVTKYRYALPYAAAGLVVGGVCIGNGISINKKKKRILQQANIHSFKNNGAYLNALASTNALGFRITF